ncbi:hypothetical protein TNCV_74061 [Trichonephila clavipes]|nr:hypothetical protein TNCV_74061 [Trichonephila clavipes]
MPGVWWIIRVEPVPSPPCSLVLIPLNFFCWGLLKSFVYETVVIAEDLNAWIIDILVYITTHPISLNASTKSSCISVGSGMAYTAANSNNSSDNHLLVNF